MVKNCIVCAVKLKLVRQFLCVSFMSTQSAKVLIFWWKFSTRLPCSSPIPPYFLKMYSHKKVLQYLSSGSNFLRSEGGWSLTYINFQHSVIFSAISQTHYGPYLLTKLSPSEWWEMKIHSIIHSLHVRTLPCRK